MLTGHSAPANPLGFANPLGPWCSVAVDQWIRAAGLAGVAVVLGGRAAGRR